VAEKAAWEILAESLTVSKVVAVAGLQEMDRKQVEETRVAEEAVARESTAT